MLNVARMAVLQVFLVLSVAGAAQLTAGAIRLDQDQSKAADDKTPGPPAILLKDYQKLTGQDRARALGDTLISVSNHFMKTFLSKLDRKGVPKSQEVLERDRRRAYIVEEILTGFDPGEIANFIQDAYRSNPDRTLAVVLAHFFTRGIVEREKELAEKKRAPAKPPF